MGSIKKKNNQPIYQISKIRLYRVVSSNMSNLPYLRIKHDYVFACDKKKQQHQILPYFVIQIFVFFSLVHSGPQLGLKYCSTVDS